MGFSHFQSNGCEPVHTNGHEPNPRKNLQRIYTKVESLNVNSRVKLINSIRNGQKKTELLVYAALWTLLFIAPLLSMYAQNAVLHQSTYDWFGVRMSWRVLSMFAVYFAIHNFLIAPLLVYGGRKWLYGVIVVVGLAGFELYLCSTRPIHPFQPGAERHMDEERRGWPDKVGAIEKGHPMEGPQYPRRPMRGPHPRRLGPPFIFGERETVSFIVMVLLLGLNVATKYFYRSAGVRKRMKALESENLQQQLEYLKYQVSPHFFMNTLNNIHALVDIDPEEAKHTIEVLSQLMRYLLYEGDKSLVPLQRAVDFIGHYVDLMRIRYANDVQIDVDLPRQLPKVMISPLLLITFVENAFKHGVSYEHPSFIEVKVEPSDDGGVCFSCRNSMKSTVDDKPGGVGLRNATKRLRLLYGDTCRLSIQSDAAEYCVRLQLPPYTLGTSTPDNNILQ